MDVIKAAYEKGKMDAEKTYNTPPPPWAQAWQKEPSKIKKNITVPSSKKTEGEEK